MKTITTLLTAAILLSGAAGAMADQQRSDEAPGYALSTTMSRGSTTESGAYASAGRGTNVGTKHELPSGHNSGSEQNMINFQALGGH
jgi:hypothetical protein